MLRDSLMQTDFAEASLTWDCQPQWQLDATAQHPLVCGNPVHRPRRPEGARLRITIGLTPSISSTTGGYVDRTNLGVAKRSHLCYGSAMRTIAQRELRNENAKVMDAVTAGETFVVTRNGEPVAELRPLRAGRRTFISRADVAVLAAANVRVDRDQFRADLDAVIDQGVVR